MINKINEVYNRINNEFLTMGPFGPMNTRNFRLEFEQRLANEFIDCIIKCDEENNSPNVIFLCCLVARVSWYENYEQKYCNLIFGQPEQAMKIQQRYL